MMRDGGSLADASYQALIVGGGLSFSPVLLLLVLPGSTSCL